MLAAIDAAAADRDTLGGIIEIRAFGCPPGLGSHTEPRLRLDARLAAAAIEHPGHEGRRDRRRVRERAPAAARRCTTSCSTTTSAATGARRTAPAASRAACRTASPIVVRVAMKPLPTLMKPLRSARLDTHEPADALVERSDTTAIARGGRGRRGRRRVRARALRAREVRRRLASATCSPPTRTTSSASRGTPADAGAEPPDRPRRLHGRRQEHGRPPARRTRLRRAVRRRRRRDRAPRRAARCASCSSATARPAFRALEATSSRELLAARRRAA